ncbi:MAG: sulfatase-like hydrolase/transferase [Clostridia bacterium]
MDKQIKTLNKIKSVGFVFAILGITLMLAMWIGRLNLIAVVSAVFCCFVAAIILVELIFKKQLNLYYFIAYTTVSFGVTMYYIAFGVDEIFILRVLYNALLALPSFLILLGLYYLVMFADKHRIQAKAIILSSVLVITSIIYVLTMSLKSKPNMVSLAAGHDEYLNNVDKVKSNKSSPNVLFVLMDDLGYGDISLNGALYDTPNIDSIAQNGLNFTNFYSSYSVCSPARFAALTGRYPYRGCADNVIYPTVQSFSPFSTTRLFNSFEMGNNVDGMLGDEITIAETLQNAGYSTGCFGKWHLGDYGQYLPTNQGFDYFYGSHHVNDMTPFYHVKETKGEYEIVVDKAELKDQSNATKLIHNEIDGWIREVSKGDQPFCAWYTTPWPHAPIFVGDEFKGKTGLGDYADCVTEFDSYLGKLLNTLDELNELDDTLIIFTSDNGPALQGSTNELRGGKYTAYEGGQKVPFLMQWKNNNGLFNKGETRDGSATLVDLYPTLVDICKISGYNGQKTSYLPFDRAIDGISMLPLINDSKKVIHTVEHPILHMKREKIKAIQYAIPSADIIAEYGFKHEVLTDNEFVTFKYFKNIQNDNSAFFDKYRKNWLHILTDDSGENYNRQPVYPTIAVDMNNRMKEISKEFKENRRGINEAWYKEYKKNR